ncbi:MAG: Gfo/Idh/MocA family protein [Chloroflexota bacterium]
MVNEGRLRVAIAGCHRMVTRTPGSHNWAAAFAAVPEVEVVAVFDRGAETRSAFAACWGETPAYDDYERMLAQVRPDVVCIATRQTMHADQIDQAMAAGVRGLLCDKPLATSLAETERIVTTLGRAGVPLAFGLDRRWSSPYRALRDAVANAVVGHVTSVIAYGLPNLINHGCHWYDAALMLAGDPEIAWVSGLVDDLSREPAASRGRLDPPGRAQIGLANGVTLYVTPDGRPGPAFEVLGERGRLLLLNDARDVSLWTVDAPAGQSGPLRQGTLDLPPKEGGWPAGPAAVRDLVQAVRRGATTACDVDEARRATEIGFAVHASSAAGGARLSVAEVDRALRIESFPWGNE